MFGRLRAQPFPGYYMREHRRSRRILASVPLEILANGETITASTGVINLHGAMIFCSTGWMPGDQFQLKNTENGLLVNAHVVWSGEVAKNGVHKLGVEFAEASPEFWGYHYDPASSATPEGRT